MSAGLRHACIAIAIVALALLSHGRILRAGWLGGDLEVLQQARSAVTAPRGGGGQRAGWLDSGRIRPVPAVVLTTHARFFGAEGPFAPGHARSLRAVALCVLLATAAAAGFALRRALLPWIGRDTARAAGFALALFFATHPLGTAAVARPAALGDLFALFFSGLAAVLFLRGRQQRERPRVVLAGVCAVLAGFSSSVALLLPVVLFGLELGSARRPRPFFTRLRTAATTFVVFLGCVLVESACAVMLSLQRRPGLTLDLPPLADLPRALGASVEKLGILFLPVPGQIGSGASLWPSYLLCGALVLIALFPVLRSARAAPRLWGWLGTIWIVIMAFALVPHAAVRVEPADYSHAEVLAAGTLFACAGLAVAATALLGTRRILLPAVISVGFAWLGYQAARGFDHAAGELEELRGLITQAREVGGRDAHVLVLDPPERAGGLELGIGSLRLLAGGEGTREPRALAQAALGILLRTAEFARWREDGLVLIATPSTFGGRADPGAPRSVRRIPATAGAAPPVLWPRGKIRSELVDLDPGATHFARIVGLPATSTAEAPRLRWRVDEPAGETFSTIGVWLAGDGAPVAVFDLAGTADWWTAATVRSQWTESPFVQVALGEMLGDVPLEIAGGAPQVRGDDWHFSIRRETLPAPVRGSQELVLEMIDMHDLSFARIRVAQRGSEDVLGLEASGAAGFERAVRARGGGPIVWSLDRRIGGSTIARATARREP